MLARNQINATIDHRSFADQGITEQPTIHEGYIAQNMEKKGMIADRCEINRQIRADNKMLRELKAKVAKLAEAVEKSIPIIAETLEAIRNHMIFTQYHLLHNEMQKKVIHDWMNHFNPILNKYNTVKKKLKAKVTERKELNVQKDKTSILNPIQHIKLNQQLSEHTDLKLLADCPFLLINKGNRVRTIADEMFEEAQITPNIVLETENIQTVLALAEKGMGITFYPRMFISGQTEMQELKNGQGPLNFYSLDHPKAQDIPNQGGFSLGGALVGQIVPYCLLVQDRTVYHSAEN